MTAFAMVARLHLRLAVPLNTLMGRVELEMGAAR